VAPHEIRVNNPLLRAALPPEPVAVLGETAADTAAAAYGRIRIDFEPLDSGAAAPPPQLGTGPAPVGVDSLGRFVPRPYRLTFSTDLVYASSEVNTLYGLQGTVQVRFSDLTGSYRLYGGSNLLLDLRNSDYVVGFQSLGGRADWSVQGAHVSRVLETDTLGRGLARYRLYSADAGLSYPLDRFRRIEGRWALLGVSEANLFDPSEPTVSRLLLYPSLTYTYDATELGAWGLRSGVRAAASLAGAPVTISGTPARFATLLADARAYVPVRRVTLALRLSGGASAGDDPQTFYTSGAQGWLNPRVGTRSRLPTAGLSEFAFATPVLPLRGYALNERNGPYFGLFNAEVRLPVAGVLRLRPLPALYGVRVAGFLDAGAVWGGPNDRRLILLSDTGRGRTPDDLLASLGAGVRAQVLGVPLGLDVAWPLRDRSLATPELLLRLGLPF
jgi:outer membrane protein assembly factor BamA